jgi:hypothetical protein
MKLKSLILLAYFAVSVTLTAPAQQGVCAGDVRPDCLRAVDFFRRVQGELRNNDRAALAAQVEYPLLTRIDHRKTYIRTRKQFLTHFDQIVDKGVRCAILNSDDKDVWGNWQGYTVKTGDIWFDAVIPAGAPVDSKAPDFWTKYPFKIKTVNNESALPCESPEKAR